MRLFIATCMDLEMIESKSDRERQMPYDISLTWGI